MASDIFAKIGDIKGESIDSKHKDEIDVLSFSWGVSQAGSFASGGGASAGKAQFNDFHFTSNMSKASPLLFKACATGEHIKEATISGRRPGGEDQGGRQGDYFIVKMNDVLITSYQSGGSRESFPTDAVSMAYAKIEFSYAAQKSDGTLEAPITAGWDLKANKKV
ncbi:MAG: type VI secretion system tube protein Hcp [Chloroflexota bacterium]